MSLPIPAPPISHPAEILDISPENLEVANAYLQSQSIPKVSEDLGVSTDVISQILNIPTVKSYINNVFLDLGFNNRFKMRNAMDAILSKKFQEMDEAGIGSSKDITELMALSHKMTMDELDRQIKLEELRNKGPKSQVNVQINEAGGSNYGQLMEKLISGNL